VVAHAQVFVLQSQRQQEVMAEGAPVVEPLQIAAGLAEELKLHLLELAYAENEVARGDLVAETLAYLTYAEGQLAPGGACHVGKVHENALCGLRTEIHGVFRILGDALEGFEHKVELTDVGEVVLAAGGAGYVFLLHICLQLRLRERVDGLGQLNAVFVGPVFDQLVGAEAFLALAAVHQGIGEAAEMAGGHPGLGVHQYGGVKADVILIFLHEFLPPGFFDVIFQLGAQRAVVPGVGEAAVDLAAGEDEAAVFAQGHDPVHGFLLIFHFFPFPRLAAAEIIICRNTYFNNLLIYHIGSAAAIE